MGYKKKGARKRKPVRRPGTSGSPAMPGSRAAAADGPADEGGEPEPGAPSDVLPIQKSALAGLLSMDLDAFLHVLRGLNGKTLAHLEVSCKAFAAREYILPVASTPAAAAAAAAVSTLPRMQVSAGAKIQRTTTRTALGGGGSRKGCAPLLCVTV